jgi:iron complex outermembrane recepter protein
MKKTALLAFVSAISFTAAPALAQSADPKPAAEAASDETDIVVTATRDKTLLSKTPIALTAITGTGLRDKGIINPTYLGEQVPGLSIDRTNGLQVTIRGVTSTDGTEKGNPSAAFLLDGVYIARPQEADVSFQDVDHVEVLKGPQGTLYGRNTTAGVINVITNRPSFDGTSGAINAGYANYKAFNVDGFFNLPVNDWAAFRVSASYDSRDSYTRGVTGDTYHNNNFRKNFSVRGQALFRLGNSGELLLRGSYSKLNGSRDSSVATSNFFTFGRDLSSSGNPGAPDPVTGAIDPNVNKARTATWAPIGDTRTALTTTFPSAKFDVPLAYTNPLPVIAGGGGTYSSGLSVHQYGGGYQGSNKVGVNDTAYNLDGEFNYDFGPVKMTYLGSIRQYEAHENANVLIGANLAGTFDGDYTQQSHELRLATTGNGAFKIQGGVYYFREESRIAFYIYNLAPFAFGNTFIYGFPQHTVSATKGAFTQATFRPAEHLRLTAGLRYTADDLNRYGHTVHLNSLGGQPLVGGQYSLDPATPAAPGGPTVGSGRSYVNDGDIKSNKVTWRVGFDADVIGGLLYGSVASGYKEGGFGDGCSTGDVGQSHVSAQGERCNYSAPFNDQHAVYYQPETLVDYELGFRGKIADGVKIDTNLFYYDYKNMQLSAIIPVNGALQTVTTNAGKASVLGWEFEAQFTPVENFNLTLGVDLTDGHFKQFCPSGLTASGGCGANANGQLANYAGQKLDRTPSTVFYSNVSYKVPVGDGNVTLSAGTRISSAYFVTVYGDNGSYWLRLKTPSQSKTQASVTYNAPNNAWYLTAFVKNIENKVALVTGSASSVTMTDPRTFGVRAGIKF